MTYIYDKKSPMIDKHEFRIIAPDKRKIIYFAENYAAWEAAYNGAAVVIGEEPEQFSEQGKVIGLMTTDISYQEAIDIMIDEAYLSKAIQKVLNEVSDYSECLEE